MHSYTNHSNFFKRLHRRSDTLVGQADYITVYHPRQLKVLLDHVADSLTQWLTNGSMPRISKALRHGTEVWKVYDPCSSQTLYFDEEDSLRVWMEERYYQ